MAYKIRYGFDRRRQDPGKRIVRTQIVASGVLVVLAGLVWFCEGGTRLLEQVFSPQPETVAEQAVAAFAGALCRGEGWYQGLAVWCRMLMDAGTI